MSSINKDTIKRENVLIVLLLCLFCGVVGYAFGADAGYARGAKDCTQGMHLSPTSIEPP